MDSQSPFLCARCSTMTLSPENVKQLFSIQGYKHRKRTNLQYSARRGCSLCQMLYEGTEGYANRNGPTYLRLYGWRDDGEGDIATPVQQTCMDTFIDVRIGETTGFTLCVLAADGG